MATRIPALIQLSDPRVAAQLVAHYDHITRLLESWQNVDAIYKAFDKVDHLATMKNLNGMDISGKLGIWLHAFLTNRK